MYRAIRDLTRKPSIQNVNATEKWISVGGGLLLIGKGLRRPGPLGWLHLAIGAATVFRGLRGYCPAKQTLQEMREHRVTPPTEQPPVRYKQR